MDYEKEYKAALERAKYALTTDMDASGHWAVTHIFPQLKKSEDEQMKDFVMNELSCLRAAEVYDTEHTERYDKLVQAMEWVYRLGGDKDDKIETKETDEYGERFEDDQKSSHVEQSKPLKQPDITEDYVSFEMAELLKEKGFNEPCYTCYRNSDHSFDFYSNKKTYRNSETFAISAPTFQMTLKWLREIHGIHIDFTSIWDEENKRIAYDYIGHGPKDDDKGIFENLTKFPKYELAQESAINYCLKNLI